MVVSIIDLEKKLRLTVSSLESGKFLLEQLNNIKKRVLMLSLVHQLGAGYHYSTRGRVGKFMGWLGWILSLLWLGWSSLMSQGCPGYVSSALVCLFDLTR